MKKMMTAVAAIAALGVSAPAWADGDNTGVDTTTLTVNASTPAKCDLSGASDVTLGEYDITNDQGRARNNIGQKIAQQLNAQNVRAWCTGATNKIMATRTSLNHTGSSGVPVDGFNTAVIYDLLLTINDAVRTDGFTGGTEATEDLDGPTVGHFGPTGAGSKVHFSNYVENSSAVTDGSTVAKRRDGYTESNARLVAGDYTGSITITVTPGL